MSHAFAKPNTSKTVCRQGAWVNLFWRTSTGVTVSFGLLFTFLIFFVAFKARRYERVGILGSLLTIYSVVLIESIAVTNTFGSGNFAIFSSNLSLSRYTIPIYHLQIILFSIIFSRIVLSLAGKFQKNIVISQIIKRTMVFIFSIFLLSLNMQIPKSEFPLTGNSRWLKFSEKINTGKPVCIPLDPIGWYFSQGCSLLYPTGTFQEFSGFDTQGLWVGKELKITIPKKLEGRNLVLLTMLVRPSTDLKSEIRARLSYTPIFGEENVFQGQQLIGGKGGQLEFILPSGTKFESSAELRVSFSENVIVGTTKYSLSENSNVMFYGY